MERYCYLDLLRVVAIGGVVYGHWLLVDVSYSGGRLSGRDAVDYLSWGRWVTWAFQVMPVFFCRRVRPCPVIDGASCPRGALGLVGA
jgi:hypothetical protein